jgi:hypothetical protein
LRLAQWVFCVPVWQNKTPPKGRVLKFIFETGAYSADSVSGSTSLLLVCA